MRIEKSMKDYLDEIKKLKKLITDSDVIVIGAGLSTSAGFEYSGERFQKYFSDLSEIYGYRDMYSGGFYDYDTPEEMWAFWSRNIYINRYMDAPKSVYNDLFELAQNKEYFVLTTNVDHCFQKAGFDKKRLFYTQGDYGLFQCSEPCHEKTYDNETIICDMVKSQGFIIDDGKLMIPKDGKISNRISRELIPVCPKCGKPMTMNLRSDSTFVQDEGWYEAAERYETFLKTNKGKKVLFLELGVGYNTPGIIKYPFWQYTNSFPEAFYVCINKGQAGAPDDILARSICIDGDIEDVLRNVRKLSA